MKLIRFITALVLLISAEIATAACPGQPSGMGTCANPCTKEALFFGKSGCKP